MIGGKEGAKRGGLLCWEVVGIGNGVLAMADQGMYDVKAKSLLESKGWSRSMIGVAKEFVWAITNATKVIGIREEMSGGKEGIGECLLGSRSSLLGSN